MSNIQTHVVERKVLKEFFALAFWSIMIVVSVIGLSSEPSEIRGFRKLNNPFVFYIISTICLLACSLLAINSIAVLFSKKPGLIIDRKGLTDNSSLLSAGFIPWSQIARFEVRQYGRRKVLYAILKDYKKHLKQYGVLKNIIIYMLKHPVPNSAVVGTMSLNIDFEHLHVLLNEHLKDITNAR